MILLMLAVQVAAVDPGPKIDLLPLVLKSMRQTLVDPESARDLRLCEPRLAEDAWAYMYSYRAKNGMGGYSMSGFATVVKEGKITATMGGDDDIGRSLVATTTDCPAVEAERLAAAMK